MERIHASCVVLGECGILVRGAPGSGKSSLVRQMLFEAKLGGRFARLVCDDQVEIEERHGRLLARAVAAIEGRLEVRGVGIIEVQHEPAAAIRLVVDCGTQQPRRMPEEDDGFAELSGVRLRRLVHHGDPSFARIAASLCGQDDTVVTLA
jgi:HPr kinase/phosphorylase